MILCLGHAADDTFRYTLARLAQMGTNYDALDVAQLAMAGNIYGRLDDIASVTLELCSNTYLLGDYDAVYLRLVETAQTAPTEGVKNRAIAQYRVLSQAITLLPAIVVNRPCGDSSNASKILHQSLLARKFGLRTPRSIVTTDVNDAIDFVGQCPNGAIIKGASAQKTWVSIVNPELMAGSFSRLGECPSLIQERILGSDIRVHVIGSQCFAEQIFSHAVDYRNGASSKHQPFSLSSTLSEVCVSLTSYLDAAFSGVDFKVDEASGELVFLEANTLPCYQGYDRRCEGGISAALRDVLLGNVSQYSERSQLQFSNSSISS